MKKDELLVIIILVAVSLGGIALFSIFNPANSSLSVRITHHGEVIAVLPISEDHQMILQDENGYNGIVIQDNTVEISEANCPEQICVNTHAISSPGETIVCLPHELIIEVIKGKY